MLGCVNASHLISFFSLCIVYFLFITRVLCFFFSIHDSAHISKAVYSSNTSTEQQQVIRSTFFFSTPIMPPAHTDTERQTEREAEREREKEARQTHTRTHTHTPHITHTHERLSFAQLHIQLCDAVTTRDSLCMDCLKMAQVGPCIAVTSF